jgi:hypothetical protein
MLLRGIDSLEDDDFFERVCVMIGKECATCMAQLCATCMTQLSVTFELEKDVLVKSKSAEIG